MFGKLQRTAEQNSEGIGLGLTISKQIVNHYGGRIDLFSRGKGTGSAFMFSMKFKCKPQTSQQNTVEGLQSFSREIPSLDRESDLDQQQLFTNEHKDNNLYLENTEGHPSDLNGTTLQPIETEEIKVDNVQREPESSDSSDIQEGNCLLGGDAQAALKLKDSCEVMVVDDNAVNLEATKTLIEEVVGEKKVQTAVSGEKAIKKFEKRIHLIYQRILEMKRALEENHDLNLEGSIIDSIPPLYKLLVIDFSMPQTKGHEVA